MEEIQRVSIHAMYYKIACEQAKIFATCDDKFNAPLHFNLEDENVAQAAQRREEFYGKREQAAVISVTFAGMAIEAFFYDYAAERLGDAFVKANLDKLDIKSKFLVYPRIVGVKSPNRGGQAYSALKLLVSLRNDLVHFKSKPFDMRELNKASDYHSDLNRRLKVLRPM